MPVMNKQLKSAKKVAKEQKRLYEARADKETLHDDATIHGPPVNRPSLPFPCNIVKIVQRPCPLQRSRTRALVLT